ncbi:unnamed protein product [Rotaria sp. Silwood1]|nr:unnamed protein product [Rotaria sp. Silwood1]CAF5112094.1 unnamed protein product [Rotaria sp. Silwood1]
MYEYFIPKFLLHNFYDINKKPAELPESKYLRVGNKNFYFDTGSNNRGVFLRISEVRPNYRTAITIPEKVWSHFRDNINDFICTMNNQRNNTTSTIDNSPLNTGENLPSDLNEEKK